MAKIIRNFIYWANRVWLHPEVVRDSRGKWRGVINHSGQLYLICGPFLSLRNAQAELREIMSERIYKLSDWVG